MGEIQNEPERLVKVDNWGIFLLQRLNHFFRKNFHCDLTIHFNCSSSDIKALKVHKLVLYACTDYFESLDLLKTDNCGDFLELSQDMEPDVVIPIISFMYTGKLEFPSHLQHKLYVAASTLRMTILTKLLDAHQYQGQNKGADGLPKMITIHHAEAIPEHSATESSQDSEDAYQPAVQLTQVPANATMVAKKVEDPIVTLTPVPPAPQISQAPQVPQTLQPMHRVHLTSSSPRLQAARVVNPLRRIVKDSLPATLPGRKLPVWKRKLPMLPSSSYIECSAPMMSDTQREEPKPTRFEWNGNLSDPMETTSVEDVMKMMAYESSQVGPLLQPICISEDTVPGTLTVSSAPGCSSSLKPMDLDNYSPSKRHKPDFNDVKELGKQQQLRSEILCREDSSGDEGNDPDELDNLEEMSNASVSEASTPKPILKSVSKPEPQPQFSPLSSKRVRFALENRGKENNSEEPPLFTEPAPIAPVVTKKKIILPVDAATGGGGGGNHARIVSEVLKKYPNLVKFNKNVIKLRIMSKGTAAVPSTVQNAVDADAKSSRPKVSYIYLKNESPKDFCSAVPSTVTPVRELDPENSVGPWICTPCGLPGAPLQFSTYPEHRQHIVEVHEIRVDVRICEHCGLKLSKRNHLLYHLYTKHSVEPPPHIKFPQCVDCGFVAMSEMRLVKHREQHIGKEELTCNLCNVVYRSQTSMECHLLSDLHIQNTQAAANNAQTLAKQVYRCPYCDQFFVARETLKEHIISDHWKHTSQAVPDSSVQGGQQVEETVVEEGVDLHEEQIIGPSSEMESMTSVASGISTSIHLVENQSVECYQTQQDLQEHQPLKEEMLVSQLYDEQYTVPVPVSITGPQVQDPGSAVPAPGVLDHDYSEQMILMPFSQPGPPRMILAPSNMVLSQLGHPGHNVILSQVIPQGRLILSSQAPVLLPPQEPQTVVYAKAADEVAPEQAVEGQDCSGEHQVAEEEEEEEEEEEMEAEEMEEVEETKAEVMECAEEGKEELILDEATTKIANDWDENSEAVVESVVERRPDEGPSRPDFF